MKRLDFTIHTAIALGWITLALVVALKIALLGNEASALGRRISADRQAMTDLRDQQSRITAQLQWEAAPPQLEEAVRRLQLPLRPADVRDGTRMPAAQVYADRR